MIKRSRTGVIFSLCSCFGALPACEQRRRPVRYLIPEGYVGCVQLVYGTADAPSLAIEDGSYVVKFPRDGRLYTSSSLEEGWARDRYYYYTDTRLSELPETGWGGGGLIWGGVIGSNSGSKTVTETFFVGTEEQYKVVLASDGCTTR